jgi:hypothetical protein
MLAAQRRIEGFMGFSMAIGRSRFYAMAFDTATMAGRYESSRVAPTASRGVLPSEEWDPDPLCGLMAQEPERRHRE